MKAISFCRQRPGGCATASFRSFWHYLSEIPFEKVLSLLQEYSLDPSKPWANHMLSVPIIAAKFSLSCVVHSGPPNLEYSLPSNVLPGTRAIHLKAVAGVRSLAKQRKLVMTSGFFQNKEALRQKLLLYLNHYSMVFLDWDLWDQKTQKKWGFPRHIVVIYHIDGEKLWVFDPALEGAQNPVETTIERVFSCLNWIHQLVFVGEKT